MVHFLFLQKGEVCFVGFRPPWTKYDICRRISLYLQQSWRRNVLSIFYKGAYDAGVEGDFEWGDCSSSTTFLQNNFNGAPVFGFPIDEDKDCAFYDPANDYFDDSECEMMFPFVCEITQVGEYNSQWNGMIVWSCFSSAGFLTHGSTLLNIPPLTCTLNWSLLCFWTLVETCNRHMICLIWSSQLGLLHCFQCCVPWLLKL